LIVSPFGYGISPLTEFISRCRTIAPQNGWLCGEVSPQPWVYSRPASCTITHEPSKFGDSCEILRSQQEAKTYLERFRSCAQRWHSK